MNTKAIFLDLDDTLLNRRKEITPGNREAIRRALEQGHKITITTGRPLESALRVAEELGLTQEGCYLIAFNGAIVYDSFRREIIFRDAIPLELAPPVFAEARRRGLHIQTYDDWNTYVEPWCEDDAEINWYCRRIKVTYEVIPAVEQLGSDPIKLLATSLDSPAPLEAFDRWLTERYPDRLNHFFSCPQLLEIMTAGMSKGSALNWFCRRMEIPVENSIACGDAPNDISMIRAAGVGVAMSNATEEVRAAADYITERDCDHDGIAEVIEKFML